MKRLLPAAFFAALSAAALTACGTPNSVNTDAPAQPEGSSGYTAKPGWATTKFAVAAATPRATDAGYQVLKAGGSAIDAAIAVQMVLTLVEPQSSGIGGGALIIHYTAKMLYGTLNWGLNAQQAIDLPNFGSFNGPSLLEAKRFAPATVDALKARGAEVREMDMTSGLQAIQKTPTGFFGGADPRREGLVLGD